MISNEMIKTVNNTHSCIINNLTDELMMSISSINAQEIAEELLNDDILPQNDSLLSYSDMLKYFIELCSYVENETDETALISDELYDKLVEKYVDLGEVQPIGSPMMNSGDSDKIPHKYPELRGSLAKVHFIWENDIPEKDSRKSLEGYFKNAIRQVKDAGIKKDKIRISVDLKYDGVSHILECTGPVVNTILTRGDVENNLGKDLTPLFIKLVTHLRDDIYVANVAKYFGLNHIPDSLYSTKTEYGIKVETFMKTTSYEKFKETFKLKRCNRRSAVMSICNQDADNIERDTNLKDYLSMQHFQISSNEELSLPDEWIPVGKINDRFQYLYVENIEEVPLDIEFICKYCSEKINILKSLAEENSIPIDGIVISILDDDIANVLGRSNDKNMFQIAFKFPAGEEKTIVEKVDFQVGPIAGNLTPVARLKPIKINGNTITNVTICNKAKMERLQIHEGDEVIIKYDIIPTIFKDSSCKCSNKPLIEFPTNCPVCDGDVVDERCINPDCPAKIVGHILNFVKKNRIGGGIGFNTIVDFVNAGFLNSIGDLYRLYQHKKELYEIQGYGKLSIDSILKGISDSRKLLPHQILGAIGIPSIGLKTMEKVCRNLNIIGNIGNLEELFPVMTQISGIGDKKAKAILEGINDKIEVIKDICSNIEILQYSKEKEYTEVVCFTNVRNEDFERFLLDKGIGVSDSFTSKVTSLIIPDEPMTTPTTKYTKAKEKGIEILKISDAYDKWNFKEG